MKRKKKESLVDKAYSLIKKNIVTLEYKPGMKLEEKDLIAETGIGRTPIREAIKMLISEGLIISYGTNSTYVKELSLKSSKDLLSLLYQFGDVIFNLVNSNGDLSDSIEKLEIALKKIDEAIIKEDYSDYVIQNSIFHKTLAKIANNEYLDAFFERLFNEEIRLSFALSIYLWSSVEKIYGVPLQKHYENLQVQHKKLIELLRAKDFEHLREAYKEHVKIGQTNLINYFSQ